ncbi:TlpA family protein disulfide reductase [Mucilaginibacter sp. SP1R1]|uniref:TlpA family protein disulfide reductase n=1 Tax=Mucilaginibacter sp. SP1R1 TaxID=2723091 RepID=UPI00160BBA8F|nr:TlpA disulfide reductase family protein [Mucilaginibacter sp. SP1R1]MBB6152394.1 thiol-disulfide isomerase/thioredoxin [Mucilaginibacter sp. SP1R1]
MKHFFCFLGLLCVFFGGAAQENRGLVGLKIGDLVPDVALGRVFNGAGLPLRLSGFRGKLLIIDFWSTYCGTCVRAMPRLDSLQRAVGHGLVILPVTVEGEERVLAMRRRNKLLQGLGLPLVLEDRVLAELFPHRMVPHDVWIGPDGRVLGFTEVWDITGERVKAVMRGGALKVVMKQDVLDYDRGKPLLVNGNGGNDSAFLYRSLLTGYLRGLPSGMGVETDSLRGLMRVRATNVTARYLYTLAYRGLRLLPEARITGPARKRLLPDVQAGTDLDSAHVYGYDLCLPGCSAALARQAIREDLDRFFRVRTAWWTGIL